MYTSPFSFVGRVANRSMRSKAVAVAAVNEMWIWKHPLTILKTRGFKLKFQLLPSVSQLDHPKWSWWSPSRHPDPRSQSKTRILQTKKKGIRRSSNKSETTMGLVHLGFTWVYIDLKKLFGSFIGVSMMNWTIFLQQLVIYTTWPHSGSQCFDNFGETVCSFGGWHKKSW